MKKFLFVLIAFFALGLSSTFARTVEKLSENGERIIVRIVSGDHEWVEVITSKCAEASYQVVDVTEAAIILKVTRDGKSFWQTIGFVFKSVLPTTAYALCMATIKNEHLCMAIYELSKALIEMRTGYVREGITHNISWLADKPIEKSFCSGTVDSKDFTRAADVATVFKEYAKKGCMPYKSTQIYTANG